MNVPVSVTLSDREEAFVTALARGAKPCRAAELSGWSASSARSLLRREHIRQAVRTINHNTADLAARFDREGSANE